MSEESSLRKFFIQISKREDKDSKFEEVLSSFLFNKGKLSNELSHILPSSLVTKEVSFFILIVIIVHRRILDFLEFFCKNRY